jgi:hypothetical protein
VARKGIEARVVPVVANPPDTQAIDCPHCGKSLRITRLHPVWGGACKHCGQLFWFSPSADTVALIIEFAELQSGQRVTSLTESTYIPADILHAVPIGVARRNRVFPIAKLGDTLVMAVGRRIELDTIETLRFVLNRRILLVVVDDNTLSHHIDYYCPGSHDRPLD